MTTTTGLTLSIASHSEVGLVRKNNQDSGYASPRLLLVADGMGGAAAGDLASAVAVQTIRAVDRPVDPDHKLTDLAAAITTANQQLADLITADFRLEGMGTTVTGALFDGHQLGLAHIGDSRAYLFRDGRLEQLTHDHSWVQSLVDDGKISPAEAAVHPHRSLLLRVLNGQTSSEPDLTTVPLLPGDRLLFCSDGLCGLVDDEEIAVGLAIADLQQALARLTTEALEAGGIDNITIILADVEVAAEDTVVVGSLSGDPEPGVPHSGAAVADPDPPAVLGAAAERDVSRALEQAPKADDEDDPTPTPTASAMDEERYLPIPPRGRRIGRPLAAVLVLVLVAAVGLGVGYAWTRDQFFVGASGGQVTIFRGVSDPIPGVSLSQVYEIQEVPVTDLPAYYQRMVDAGIAVADLSAARVTVAELDQQAQRCRRERELGDRPSADPSPSTSTSTSASTSASASASTGGSPRTSASPTATATAGTSPTGSATAALPGSESCR